MNENVYRRFWRFIATRKFFWIILAIFAVESAWIALTSRYPMAFDEQFHFGIIKIYAQHWSPFLQSQPANTGQYGPITTDPSYLYHYLMSFPYRLTAIFVHSQIAQIIILRFINIALLGWGLVIFRRVLERLRLPGAAINIVLLLFVMIPVTSLLGGQINYDNLVIPMSGLAILWCLDFIEHFRRDKLIKFNLLGRLVILSLLGSLVQQEFLAVAAGLMIAIGWALLTGDRLQILQYARRGFKALAGKQILVYSLLVIISLGMFLQRYGVDLVLYHKFPAACNQVLSVEECMANGPFARSYQNHHINPPLSLRDKVFYPGVWVKHNIQELTFAISSSFESDNTTVDYYVENPLPVMMGLTWTILVGGAILIARYARRLWRDDVAHSFMIISSVYLAALYLDNFHSFLHERSPSAIHGRYLFPVIILLFGLGAQALIWFLKERRWAGLRVRAAAILIIIILLAQGGFVTYIVRSHPSWSWPSNTAARAMNQGAKSVIRPLVIGS